MNARARARAGAVPWEVVIGAVVALLLTRSLIAGPHFVTRIAIVNRSDALIALDVAGADGRGWMSLDFAAPKETTVVTEVVDQGAVWTFRARDQGDDVGTFSLRRRDLVKAGWRVAIPDSVLARVRAG
jgi:hypothetical protein